MSKKRFYQVIFNSENKPEKPYHFKYKYNKTEITLDLSENFIDISMSMDARDVNFNNILEFRSQGFHACLNDAIEHAFLIHLIRYSKHINIEKVTAKIDEDEEVIFEKNRSGNFPIFSLINGSLREHHEFPERWSNSQKICDTILARRKSSFNSLDSALFALIYSKSKEYETERLVYLWMAMNGMYNHFTKMVNIIGDVPRPVSDRNQMKLLLRFCKFGKNILTQAQRNTIAKDVISVLENYEGDLTKEMLLPDKQTKKYNNQLANDIYLVLSAKQVNNTPYGFLLFELPYYYRCKIFHANKPIYFFSSEDEVKILRIINNLMEKFLEEYIIEWFEDDFVTSVDQERVNIDEIDSPIRRKISENVDNGYI